MSFSIPIFSDIFQMQKETSLNLSKNSTEKRNFFLGIKVNFENEIKHIFIFIPEISLNCIVK